MFPVRFSSISYSIISASVISLVVNFFEGENFLNHLPLLVLLSMSNHCNDKLVSDLMWDTDDFSNLWDSANPIGVIDCHNAPRCEVFADVSNSPYGVHPPRGPSVGEWSSLYLLFQKYFLHAKHCLQLQVLAREADWKGMGKMITSVRSSRGSLGVLPNLLYSTEK